MPTLLHSQRVLQVLIPLIIGLGSFKQTGPAGFAFMFVAQ
ncbi:hypothetical protein AAZX31_13G264800 [Glycine max]